MFKGSFTALITPFKGGKVDDGGIPAAGRVADRRGHARPGAGRHHGREPDAEPRRAQARRRAVHQGRQEARAGDRRRRLQLHRRRRSTSPATPRSVGADAVLHSTGYYNKPTQDGLYRHFKAISDAVDIPIFVYNVPVRTIVDISGRHHGALRASSRTWSASRMPPPTSARVTQQRLACGKDFVQLSGEDATVLGFMAHGGHGCISVTANVAPRLCSRLPERLPQGRLEDGARAAGQADAAARRAVRRDQSGAGEVCGLAARHHRLARVPAAAGAAHRGHQEGGRRGARRASASLQAKAAE